MRERRLTPVTKVADIGRLLASGRESPKSVFPILRELAASEEWQSREVAATAIVELSKRDPDAVAEETARWARDRDSNTHWIIKDGLRKAAIAAPRETARILKSLDS